MTDEELDALLHEMPPPATLEHLQARVRDLETALVHVRAVAQAERQAADQARESARHAWALTAWGAPRAHEKRQEV